MAGSAKYKWPPVESLLALVKKHGQREAANRLGVPRTTLASHLDKCGVEGEVRRQAPESLNADALREVAELVR